jgi:uncharacterized protein involved in exopolysaccharide biosynthesis
MRTPKYVKEKLVELIENKRSERRCSVVKELHEEFKERHLELYNKRDELVEKRGRLADELEEAREEHRVVLNEIAELKRTELINNTDKVESGKCRVGKIHPKIAEYDDYTDECIVRIMQAEEITLDEAYAMLENN